MTLNPLPMDHPDVQPFRWEGRSPACLLIHGLTSTPWEVRPVGLALREAGFHAESLWLPGHGTEVEELARVPWQRWTGAVENRLQEMRQRHDSVAVLGTSLGGSLALWLAATQPVAAVVSMGGAVKLPWMARFAGTIARVRPFVPKRPRGSAIRDDAARSIHPSYRRSSMRAVGEMYRLTERLRPLVPRITAPLLVMHGRLDSVIPTSNAVWIYEHAASPVKRLVWLEESDHIITEDLEHEQVREEAVAWIRAAAGGGGSGR